MTNEYNDRPDIDRVRDATDIVRIVGEHVDLKPRGREYVGLCPFHDDRKPSMYVVPAKQIYHCFVCNAGGDAFNFVQNYHKMTFGEALRFLAERAGVKLTERTRRRTKQDDDTAITRSHLLEANDAALRFFRSILKHPEHGNAARDIIERRGITPDMVEAFGIGASPDRWDGLSLFIESKERSPEPFLAAGLIKNRDNGEGRYDALRNRLVFPIRDRIGRTIAFGGRIINPEDAPKYLNSPETPLFDKSATLFGLDLASRAIQRTGTAVVAEGYTDVIACHQAGFANVVATLGTALTDKHAVVLRQLCHTVILLFDGDDAGQRAADRAAEVFLKLPIDVRIATLAGKTEAKDPDELLKSEGGHAVLEQVFADAIDLLEFRYRRLKAELDGAGPAKLESRIREEMRDLGRLGLASADKVRWQFVIRKLNDLTGLDPDTIAQLVREGAKRSSRAPAYDSAPNDAHEPAQPAPTITLERSTATEAVGCLLADPPAFLGLKPDERQTIHEAATGTPLETILSAIEAVASETATPSLNAILDRIRAEGRDFASDTAQVITLERDLARRVGHDAALIRDTLRACIERLRRNAPRPVSQGSALDRIQELKQTRLGSHAIDRTRLPRTDS